MSVPSNMASKHAAVSVQLHPPTGVTHCASAYLTHPASPGYGPADAAPPNLVLARSTALELYTVRQTQGAGAGVQETKLELVYRCRLYGVVESLAVLRGRPGRAGWDALMLTFRDAKLSVLRWDGEHHELVPSSLHYFEGDESLRGGRAALPRPPFVVAEPSGRCAAVVMFRQQLAVLPAMESEVAALGVEDLYGGSAVGGTGGTASVGNSYVDNLGKMGMRDVRDAAFLHGYNEPVLLVLHEGDPTWAGNLRIKKDTCLLSALSLNVSAKRHTRIWGAQALPSDAYRLLPAPSGGALVLCLNMVLYYSQAHHAGAVLHSAAIPAPSPPPPLTFDMSREAPGETAAKYARAHAAVLHPEAAAAALSFCDTSAAAWNLECDAAHAAWLDPGTALLGLKSGQLLCVELARLGGGGVKLRVARAGAGPPAACVAALSRSLAFVGSLSGDSLLVACELQTLPPGQEQGGGGGGGGEHSAKRRRLQSADADQAVGVPPLGAGPTTQGRPGGGAAAPASAAAVATAAEEAAAAAAAAESDEEALLYGGRLGDEHAGGSGAAASGPRCSLHVLDSLVGLGPLRSMAVSSTTGSAGGAGGAPYLLACCGQERNGALAVLRQSVAPDVLTEVPLPGVRGAWAVRQAAAASEQQQPHGPQQEQEPAPVPYHSFLLLSFEGSTKVLATGEELQEVTDLAEFAVDTATIAAGEVCGGRRLLQAFPQGLRLLEAGEQRQEVWAHELGGAPEGAGVVLSAVHVQDPYVLAQLSDGTARLLRADADSHELRADALGESAALRGVAACCLYLDRCGWLRRHLAAPAAGRGGPTGEGGEAGDVPVYCVVCYTDGSLAMWALPGLQAAPAWRCAALPAGARVLLPSAASAAQAAAAVAMSGSAPFVVEIRMDSFAGVGDERPGVRGQAVLTPACDAPVLLAVTSEDTLLAYKAFACDTAAARSNASGVRMARLQLEAPALLPPAAPGSGGAAALPRLIRFDGLGEELPCSGIFVAGASPLWLVASRGTLVPHPAHLPQGVAAAGFTPFHNVNCPHGFIIACSGARGAIQISQLPRRQRLDAPWPRQKVALRATPLRVCLYAEAGLFALLTARQAPATPFLPEEEGGEPQASYSYALAGAAAAARGSLEQHELCLVQPGGWGTLWRYALLPGEQALTVEAVHLRDATTGATVPLLAVGAGFAAGEDYPCSGRVLLFEVRRRAEGGGAGVDPGWGAALVYAREFKGPVTALSTLEGYLLLATGNRLESCTLTSSTGAAAAGSEGGATTAYRLQRSAFYDGPTLVTSLSVVKSFVLLGDAAASLQFVRYREEGKQLGLLSKDFGRAPVRAAQFLIAGSSLHLVGADGAGTLRAYTYAPKDGGSWGGQKLLLWGSFHVGDRAGAMLRARVPAPDAADTAVRHAVLYGTDAGAIGVLAPLALGTPLEQQQQQQQQANGSGGSDAEGSAPGALAALRALQGALTTDGVHAAGLHPGAFRRRYARIPLGLEGGQPHGGQPLALSSQGILDGDLLLSYVHLPLSSQLAVAQRARLQRAHVLQALSTLAHTWVLL